MQSPAANARALRAAENSRALGITQAQIAEAVGASQSQVSRILGGGASRESRLLEEVCLFIERFEVGITADAVRQNDELIDAVRTSWDGTAIHARALSTVIKSLAALRAPHRPSETAEDAK